MAIRRLRRRFLARSVNNRARLDYFIRLPDFFVAKMSTIFLIIILFTIVTILFKWILYLVFLEIKNKNIVIILYKMIIYVIIRLSGVMSISLYS